VFVPASVTSVEAAQAWRRARLYRFLEPFPATTVLVFAALLDPGWCIEVDAVGAAKSRQR
jgi:enamine deaminase RidA (YjgF/YER057c/UK114 family)